jgi:hypothetical protein
VYCTVVFREVVLVKILLLLDDLTRHQFPGQGLVRLVAARSHVNSSHTLFWLLQKEPGVQLELILRTRGICMWNQLVAQ